MMSTDEERREVARKLRDLSSEAEEVSDFDLAKTLGLEAVSRYGYDADDVLRLADLIDPERYPWCRVCGHPIPDGYDRCPKCLTPYTRDLSGAWG